MAKVVWQSLREGNSHVLYRSGFQVYFDRAFDYSDFFVRLHRNI